MLPYNRLYTRDIVWLIIMLFYDALLTKMCNEISWLIILLSFSLLLENLEIRNV
jgi:hypothetical protein